MLCTQQLTLSLSLIKQTGVHVARHQIKKAATELKISQIHLVPKTQPFGKFVCELYELHKEIHSIHWKLQIHLSEALFYETSFKKKWD